MKKLISLMLCLGLIFLFSGTAMAESATGEAQGFGGIVSVTLSVEDGTLTDVEIVGDAETEGVGKAAIPVMAERMLETGSIAVDGVTGASITSKAVTDAAALALESLGLTQDDLKASEGAEPVEAAAYVPAFDDPDVIVIGGGGSGIIAAISAAEAGAKVYLYEKTGMLGGSNNYSGGSLSAAGTQMQADAGIEDSPENFAADLLRMGGGTNVEELTITHVNHAVEAVEWVDSLGVDLGDRIPTMSAAYDAFNVPRQYMMHFEGKQSGKGLLDKIIPLLKSKEEAGEVAIFMNTEIGDIILDDGAVVGVVVNDDAKTEVYADSVILATGGYGHSEELVKRYNFKNAVSTAPEFATGDGYRFAEKAGAQFSNMDYCPGYVGAVPVNSGTFSKTVGVDSSYAAAIWVNLDGVRACAEIGGLDSQKKGMYEDAPENLVFFIIDQEARDTLPSIISGDDENWSKFEELLAANDCVYKGDTIEELAEQTGIDAEALAATIEAYNGYAEKGKDEAFGRDPETLVALKTAPYYAIKSCPSVLLTKGGPLMNSDAQILNTEGDPIVGLYQCGEIVGGANIGGSASIGGLANTINIVWGKIAGRSAAAYALNGTEATAGDFTGRATGINGELAVTITVNDEGVVSVIDVTDNQETVGVGRKALEILSDQAVRGQTSNVDIVSGATVTSLAFRAALKDALAQAGLAEAFAAAPAYVEPEVKLEDMEADVVVVGAGLAGLTASVEAAKNGLDVVLLEKNPYTGGDTLIAVGWISGHGNRMQLAAGTEVSIPNDPDATPMNYKIAVESGPALDSLMDDGVEFTPTTTYSTSFNPGYEKGNGVAMAALTSKADELGVRIYLSTPAIDLIEEDGACVGVVAQQADGNTFEVRAKATVIAAGGYQKNPEAVKQYNPDYADFICSGMPGATGDWLEWLPKFDIALYGTDAGLHMQPATSATNRAIAFLVTPSVIVDMEGNRFANESTSYNPVAKAAKEAGIKEMVLIMDEAMKATEAIPGLTDSIIRSGAGEVFGSIEELAEAYGLTNLPETIERYNAMAEAGEDEDFGRTNFSALSGDTYYAIKARPTTYASYGGILIDTDFHVQTNDGQSVPGLYAIGAASGSYLVLEGTGASSPGLTAAMTSGYCVGNQLAEEIGK